MPTATIPHTQHRATGGPLPLPLAALALRPTTLPTLLTSLAIVVALNRQGRHFLGSINRKESTMPRRKHKGQRRLIGQARSEDND